MANFYHYCIQTDNFLIMFLSIILMCHEVNAPHSNCVIQGSELESWEDEGESAWAAEAEEDLSWQAEATLREKRRREREQRQLEQHRKKQERAMGKTREGASVGHRGQLSAVRLS